MTENALFGPDGTQLPTPLAPPPAVPPDPLTWPGIGSSAYPDEDFGRQGPATAPLPVIRLPALPSSDPDAVRRAIADALSAESKPAAQPYPVHASVQRRAVAPRGFNPVKPKAKPPPAVLPAPEHTIRRKNSSGAGLIGCLLLFAIVGAIGVALVVEFVNWLSTVFN